jgi:hypothetical protein
MAGPPAGPRGTFGRANAAERRPRLRGMGVAQQVTEGFFDVFPHRVAVVMVDVLERTRAWFTRWLRGPGDR